MASRGILQILDIISSFSSFPWTYPIGFKVERPILKLKFFAVTKPSTFVRIIWKFTILAYISFSLLLLGVFITELNLKVSTLAPIQVIIFCVCFGGITCESGPFFFTLYHIRNADMFNGLFALERRLQKQRQLVFNCKSILLFSFRLTTCRVEGVVVQSLTSARAPSWWRNEA